MRPASIVVLTAALVLAVSADADEGVDCEDAVLARDVRSVRAVQQLDGQTYVSQRRDDRSPWEVVRYLSDGHYEILHQFHTSSPFIVTHLVELDAEIFGIVSREDCFSPSCEDPRGFLFRLHPGYLESLVELTAKVEDLIAGDGRLFWTSRDPDDHSSLNSYDLASAILQQLYSGDTITDVELSDTWIYFSEARTIRRIPTNGGEAEAVHCCATDFIVDASGQVLFQNALVFDEGYSVTTIERFDPETGEVVTFQRALGTNFGISYSGFELLEGRDGRVITLYVSCGKYCQRTPAVVTSAALTMTGTRAYSQRTTSAGVCRVDLFDPGPLWYLPGHDSRLLRASLNVPLVDSVQPRRASPGGLIVLQGKALDQIDLEAIEVWDSGGRGAVVVAQAREDEIALRVWPTRLGGAWLSLPSIGGEHVHVPLELHLPRQRSVSH